MKFDLSQTKLIHRRTLKFPIKMSKELAELIGIHFGDGSLYKDLNHNYTLSYAGNLKKDRDYMNYIDFLCTKMSPNIFVWGLKPRPLGRHFWHPKNPLSKENSVKPAPLGAGRSFLWIFMINVAF